MVNHIGIQTGDEKDVVDQPQQLVGVFLDFLDEERFILWVVLRLKEFGKAHHRIERGTYLIAHIGEERLLQKLRLLGFLRLHSQTLLCLHHLRHVTADAEIALYLALFVKQWHHIEQQPYLTALAVADLRLDSVGHIMTRQMIHAVEHTGDITAEAR